MQVEVLTKKHHIYLTKDGRISMAGEHNAVAIDGHQPLVC
jgi:aspartate/tyrosine/aromatic aminotransferase